MYRNYMYTVKLKKTGANLDYFRYEDWPMPYIVYTGLYIYTFILVCVCQNKKFFTPHLSSSLCIGINDSIDIVISIYSMQTIKNIFIGITLIK